jgi:hypothetical protein
VRGFAQVRMASCAASAEKFRRTMSISESLVRRFDERPMEAGANKETDDAGYGVRESH